MPAKAALVVLGAHIHPLRNLTFFFSHAFESVRFPVSRYLWLHHSNVQQELGDPSAAMM